MATHSSTLVLRVPWTEEPGGLQSMGSQRVRHDWSNLARMWELIFLTRDRTHAPCIGRQSVNHWATKEVPDENIFIIQVSFFKFFYYFILFFNFTILYWFYHISTWLRHETAKETLMYRTVFWTLWERERVGWFERMAFKSFLNTYCVACGTTKRSYPP